MLSEETVQDAVKYCLNRFPRIYYFLNLAQERTVKRVKLDREDYAILWLCATLIKERGKGYCLQQDVHKVFLWWRPPHQKDMHSGKKTKEKPDTHFTKLLNQLEEAGYIGKGVHKANKNTREIRITRAGHKLLNDIKAERERSIRSLIGLVRNQKELRNVLKSVDAIANYAWRTMRTYEKPNWAEGPSKSPKKPSQKRRQRRKS